MTNELIERHKFIEKSTNKKYDKPILLDRAIRGNGKSQLDYTKEKEYFSWIMDRQYVGSD